MDLFADLPEPTNETAVQRNNGKKDERSKRDIQEKRKSDTELTEGNAKKPKIEIACSLKGYYAERKGEREEMQDAHVIIDNFATQICQVKKDANLDSQISAEICRLSYYAVFDGHAGCRAAQYAAKHLHVNIAKLLPIGSLAKLEGEIKRCFIGAFKKTDDDFLKVAAVQKPTWKDGSTAIVVLAVNDTLYVANLGDSKAVLCRQQQQQAPDTAPPATYHGVPLSTNHSPSSYDERQRVQKAGGTVTEGRVLGVLEVSRSIGDGQFKKHGVICVPDVKRCQITPMDRYIVIACDGLWKAFNPDAAIHYINDILKLDTVGDDRKQLQSVSGGGGDDARVEAACGRICVEAVKRCSGDNVTVLIVNISPAATMVDS